jgi:hypothetical protein
MLFQHCLSSKELKELENALNSATKDVNICLREGEYQYSLVKAIASFELELHFPDSKELARKLFGERNVEDTQFVSKIQTILKKMEKSGIVIILPKEKPWQLQRYALTSFKFQDVEKNETVFATKADIEKTRELIRSQQNLKPIPAQQPKSMNIQISLLVSTIIVSFVAILWTFTQPTLNLIVFVLAFCIATTCSTILGILISRKK